MAIIGIDLGTTNSLASVWKDGRVQLIPNAFGEYLTPSVVSINGSSEVIVGKTAKEMLITRPEETFCEFKRNMGTDTLYKTPAKEYRAEELSAFVLRKLKEDAERFLGEPVTEAIISVPAYFNDDKRCATKNAGKLAGLKVERLINEPSAVALKYHGDRGAMETFIVFDFGGGTLDVSLVDAFDNMVEILAVSGDNYLGGKDFNEVIAEHFYWENGLLKNQYSEEEQGIVIKEAELLKRELTIQDKASRTILLGEKEYVMKMTNQELIHISTGLFQRMAQPIQKVMNDCGKTWEDIDKVILAGGSSKMPIVAKYIKSICETEVVIDKSPDESIALGVGMAAAIKMRTGEIRDMILSDICPYSLGIDIVGNKFSPIIERNEALPCSRTSTYFTVFPYQTEAKINIYQGESMVASENLLLGTMTISDIPPKREAVPLEITFMYDINGILDIKAAHEKQEFHKVILNKNMGLSEKELEERLKELQEMTLQPQEQEQNRFLVEEAKRLYRECHPKFRAGIQERLESFELTMQYGSSRNIREEYVRFAVFLKMIEQNKFNIEDFDESFWDEDE